jgi:hypothetical protein
MCGKWLTLLKELAPSVARQGLAESRSSELGWLPAVDRDRRTFPRRLRRSRPACAARPRSTSRSTSRSTHWHARQRAGCWSCLTRSTPCTAIGLWQRPSIIACPRSTRRASSPPVAGLCPTAPIWSSSCGSPPPLSTAYCGAPRRTIFRSSHQQVRAGDQPQDRQVSRTACTRHGARPRRRGDRIELPLLHRICRLLAQCEVPRCPLCRRSCSISRPNADIEKST